jgi:nicotinamide-nucleotide amidase
VGWVLPVGAGVGRAKRSSAVPGPGVRGRLDRSVMAGQAGDGQDPRRVRLVTPVEDLVLELLEAHGWTISVAESLTAGSVTARLCSCPGAGHHVLGGIVTYSTAAKQKLLGLATDQGVVSADVALAMAEGARRLFGSDVGVSTTGVAGPDEQDGQPVGTVHVGWSTPLGRGTIELACAGAPEQIRAESSTAALRSLLDQATAQTRRGSA